MWRGRGNGAFIMSIIMLYIKYPLQSLGVSIIIVFGLNLYVHQEFIEPILFTIIFGGGLLLLSIIFYYYFIKNHNQSKKIGNKKYNRELVIKEPEEAKSYKITDTFNKVRICSECGKEFLPVKNSYNLCFSCRKNK